MSEKSTFTSSQPLLYVLAVISMVLLQPHSPSSSSSSSSFQTNTLQQNVNTTTLTSDIPSPNLFSNPSSSSSSTTEPVLEPLVSTPPSPDPFFVPASTPSSSPPPVHSTDGTILIHGPLNIIENHITSLRIRNAQTSDTEVFLDEGSPSKGLDPLMQNFEKAYLETTPTADALSATVPPTSIPSPSSQISSPTSSPPPVHSTDGTVLIHGPLNIIENHITSLRIRNAQASDTEVFLDEGGPSKGLDPLMQNFEKAYLETTPTADALSATVPPTSIPSSSSEISSPTSSPPPVHLTEDRVVLHSKITVIDHYFSFETDHTGHHDHVAESSNSQHHEEEKTYVFLDEGGPSEDPEDDGTGNEFAEAIEEIANKLLEIAGAIRETPSTRTIEEGQ